jgi:hypothetical protein
MHFPFIFALLITAVSCSDVAPTTQPISKTDDNPAGNGNDNPEGEETGSTEEDFGIAMGKIPYKIFDYVKNDNNTFKLDLPKDSEIISAEENNWKSLNTELATFSDGYLDAGRVGKLELANDASSPQKKVAIRIHSVKANIYVGNSLTAAQNLNFGSLRIGESLTQQIQLENLGQTTFAVSSIRIIGKDESSFKVEGKPPRLIENTRGTFSITFTPSSSGAKIATVVIEALIEDKPGAEKSILLMALKVSGFAQHQISQLDSQLTGDTFFAKNGALYAENNEEITFPIFHEYGTVGSYHTARIKNPSMINFPAGNTLSPAISPSISFPTEARTLYTNSRWTVYKMVSCYGTGPASCYGPISPDIRESLYMDSIIDTDFGFLVTTYAKKPTEYFVDLTYSASITKYYPDKASYNYYVTESGRTAPAVPASLSAMPGRLKAAFCLGESCFFKYTDLSGGVKIVSHLFEEILTSYSIVDVLAQSNYKDGVLILAKTKLNNQNSPTLKIFHAKKNNAGSPDLTEISWPTAFKSTLEGGNLADVVAIGESVGILVDQSFLILRSFNNQFDIRMRHVNISTAMTAADGRRNQNYTYDLGNIFDNEKSRKLYRISDDFLVRDGGKFYVISPKDPASEIFSAEVPNNTALGQ